MRTFFGASKAALHKFEAMFFKLFFIILGIIIIVLRISDEVKTSALPFKSLFFSNGKNTELKIKFFFRLQNFLTFQKYIVRSMNLCELAQPNVDSSKNMLLLKNPQCLPNYYETWLK